MKLTLPTDSAARKRFPLRTGCFNYFPAALAGVAEVSIDGNDKHNPGQPLHHARGKSADHADCIDRHLTDVQDLIVLILRAQRGEVSVDPGRSLSSELLKEVNQLAWRALALSQEIHETYGGAPLAPAAKLDARPEGRLDDEWKKTPYPPPPDIRPGQVVPVPPGQDIARVLEKFEHERKRREAERDAKPGEVFPRYPGRHPDHPNTVYLHGGPATDATAYITNKQVLYANY